MLKGFIIYVKKIAKSEKNVDFEVLELAALLHDIGRKKEDLDKTGRIDHAIESAKMAEKILEKFGFQREKIEKVKKSHNFSSI
jgi:putative nucleotidyltransferase with HDIG domain